MLGTEKQETPHITHNKEFAICLQNPRDFVQACGDILTEWSP